MQKLRFLHIPKTAGTTFSALLSNSYRKEQVVDISEKDFNKKFSLLSQSERQSIGLVIGHGGMKTGFGEIDSMPVVTFFRDPISRVESFCQHVWEGKSPQYWETYPPLKFDIETFLNDPEIIELENGQTRRIVGEVFYKKSFHSEELILKKVRDVLNNELNNFGLTERYGESLLLLKNEFSDISIYTEKRNIRNQKKTLEINAAGYELIKEKNQLDIKTYAIAQELFLSRLDNFENQDKTDSLSELGPKNFMSRKADINLLQNALKQYHEKFDQFPISHKWDGYKSKWGRSQIEWIQGLVPEFINALPRDPRMTDDAKHQYLYRSDGSDYKIIAHAPEDYDLIAQKNSRMIDMHPSRRAYGVWTKNAKHW